MDPDPYKKIVDNQMATNQFKEACQFYNNLNKLQHEAKSDPENKIESIMEYIQRSLKDKAQDPCKLITIVEDRTRKEAMKRDIEEELSDLEDGSEEDMMCEDCAMDYNSDESKDFRKDLREDTSSRVGSRLTKIIIFSVVGGLAALVVIVALVFGIIKLHNTYQARKKTQNNDLKRPDGP